MPAYNCELTIVKAIESVLRQKDNNWELIIIDDGSFDSTVSICKQFVLKDSRIKLFQQKNSGPGSARNNGISNACGEYLCFLDSDDYWDDDFLLLISQKLSLEKYDVVFYDTAREDNNGKTISYSCPSAFKNRSKSDLLILQAAGTIEWGMTKIVKTSVVKNNNILFSTDSVGEEALFSFDIIYYSNNVSFIEKPIYHYINYSSGQHNKGELDPWHEVVANMKKHLYSLKNFNDEKYKIAVNSLALKALCINVNRICKSNNRRQAISKIKESIKKYKADYDVFTFNRKYLLKKIYLVGIALKLKALSLIYCMAKR